MAPPASSAPALFRSLGAEVIAIHDQPNGRNINDGCGSLHPEKLREKVLETRAALGVAFDGDADRAMFVSAGGRHVDGDGVLLAAARYFKSVGKLRGGRVIGTTMANLGLERVLEAEGLSLARVPVGDRYVLEEMLRSGANLGGEQSGHIIFLDDATTGDGLLTALKMACLVALRGPLDELIHGLKVFPQTIVNVKVKSKPPLESLPVVSAAIEKATKSIGRRRDESSFVTPAPNPRRVSWSKPSTPKTFPCGLRRWPRPYVRLSGSEFSQRQYSPTANM